MLISYNFYNSILLQKMLNHFIRRGEKEKVERIFYRFLLRFARARNFLVFWLLLAVVEFHKPVLAFLAVKHKNKIVYKLRYNVRQASLLSVGLKWLKEGVLGSVSPVKKKRQYKILRKQAKIYQAKAKDRGFVLTQTELLVIQNAKALALYRRKSIVFSIAFEDYILLSSKKFQASFGYKQQVLHNKIAIESHLYHSYKWS
jgi:hypothetical protein